MSSPLRAGVAEADGAASRALPPIGRTVPGDVPPASPPSRGELPHVPGATKTPAQDALAFEQRVAASPLRDSPAPTALLLRYSTASPVRSTRIHALSAKLAPLASAERGTAAAGAAAARAQPRAALRGTRRVEPLREHGRRTQPAREPPGGETPPARPEEEEEPQQQQQQQDGARGGGLAARGDEGGARAAEGLTALAAGAAGAALAATGPRPARAARARRHVTAGGGEAGGERWRETALDRAAERAARRRLDEPAHAVGGSLPRPDDKAATRRLQAHSRTAAIYGPGGAVPAAGGRRARAAAKPAAGHGRARLGECSAAPSPSAAAAATGGEAAEPSGEEAAAGRAQPDTAAPPPPAMPPLPRVRSRLAGPAHASPAANGSAAEVRSLSSMYALRRQIGDGAFGQVRLATHLLSGCAVAIKATPAGALGSARERHRAQMEWRLQAWLDHPHIAKVIHVVESARCQLIVQELVDGGSLATYLQMRGGRVAEGDAASILKQGAAALCYCHARSVYHRDVKLDNLLLDKWGTLKLADFGLAVRCSGAKLSMPCGSLLYNAPEIIANLPYDGGAVDVWAFGVTAFVMTHGHFPFDGSNLKVLQQRIRAGRFRVDPSLSAELAALLRAALCPEPSRRPSMAELLRHPWMERFADPSLAVVGPEGRPPARPDVDAWAIARLAESSGRSAEEVERRVRGAEADEYVAAGHLLLRWRREHEALWGPGEASPAGEGVGAGGGAASR